MALPNLADLKAHLNMATATHDDELQEMLDAAIEIADSIAGPLADTASTVTEVHRGVNSDRIVLRQMPASALASVSTRYGLTTTAQTLADYELDTATGIVRSIYGAQFYGDFVIEYTAGSDTLPASLRLGILLIAAHLWETQRGVSPSALALQQVEADPSAFPVGAGYAIPNRARELLASHVRPSLP